MDRAQRAATPGDAGGTPEAGGARAGGRRLTDGVDIEVVRGLRVPMRDGVTLAADVYRPAGHPAIATVLIRTSYDRTLLDGFAYQLDPVRTAEHGYAVVVQDVRGVHGSEGTFGNFHGHEGPDGADSARWILEQGWSGGRVGMAGASYLARTQLAAAAEPDSDVSAISPYQAPTGGFHDLIYSGGALNRYIVEALIARNVELAIERDGLPAARVAELEQALLLPPLGLLAELLRAGSAVSDVADVVRPLVEHDRLDEFWLQRDPLPALRRSGIPALHTGGWYDACLAGTLRSFTSLSGEGARGRGAQHLIVGPWAHARPESVFADPSVPRLAPLDLFAEQLAFYRRYLADSDDEIPAVRYFVMGRNTWVDADGWPPTDVQWRHLYLCSDGNAELSGGGGWLGVEPGEGAAEDRFLYDPSNPAPTIGGQTLLAGPPHHIQAGPLDQAELARRSDVLVYRGAPLERELEVTGEVHAQLFVSTTGLDTDVVAKLVDVHPDGRELIVCEGILAARFRHRLSTPILLEPGEIAELNVLVGATSYCFAAGHRIALYLTSSSFPQYLPNPNTGVRAIDAGFLRPEVVRQTVYHDADRPSRLRIPVR